MDHGPTLLDSSRFAVKLVVRAQGVQEAAILMSSLFTTRNAGNCSETSTTELSFLFLPCTDWNNSRYLRVSQVY